MPLQIYKSSNSGSCGGTISSQLANTDNVFETIRAIPEYVSIPNSVTGGTIYKKLFLKNDTSIPITNTKLYFDFMPSTGPYMLGLAPGTADDFAPPDESLFSGKDIVNPVMLPDLAPGESAGFWVFFGWPENSGNIDPCQIGIAVTGGENAKSFLFKFMVELYEFGFPVDHENDYTSAAKDIFLVFFRNLFYKFYRMDLRWSPIPELSKIAVVDRLTYSLEEPEARPAIIVCRGGMSFSGSSKDQMLKMRLIDGDAYYTDLIRGSMTFQCVAREGLHAEFLAQTVFKALNFFRQSLRNMGLHEINRTNMGEEVSIISDTRPEAIMVPVSTQIAFQDKWFVSRHRARIGAIDYTIEMNKTGCRAIGSN